MKIKSAFFRPKRIKLKNLLILLLGIILGVMVAINLLFFTVSSMALEKQSGAYFSSICAQIEQDVRINNRYIEKSLENICTSSTIQEYLRQGNDINAHKAIVGSVRDILSLNDTIETIKIYSNQSFTISVAEQEPIAIFDLMQKYSLPDQKIRKPFYSLPTLSFDNKNTYYAYIYPVFSMEYETFKDNIGTAVALVNFEKVLSLESSTNFLNTTSCLVLDRDNNIIYNTGNDDPQAFLDACLNKASPLSEDVSFVKYDGESRYFSISDIAGVDWKIILSVERELLAGGVGNLRLAMIALSVLSGVVILFIAVLLMRSITTPIQSMATDMSKVHLGNRNIRVNSPSGNELGELAEHINAMLDELDASARKIILTQNHLYEAELAERKSQMLALQSQINPHFLYNTLECVQSIALVYGAEKIETIASSMAGIYRYAIGEDSAVTIEEELDCVNHYLRIMRIRFDCNALLELDIPRELMGCKIMRMSLQPLAENAFTHGLERTGGEGFIRIGASEREGRIYLSVINSGGTISNEKAREINDMLRKNPEFSEDYHINGGLALININRRLQLSGGPESGVFVDVTEEGYTRFTLVFIGA